VDRVTNEKLRSHLNGLFKGTGFSLTPEFMFLAAMGVADDRFAL
jgi:hypothetical protein